MPGNPHSTTPLSPILHQIISLSTLPFSTETHSLSSLPLETKQTILPSIGTAYLKIQSLYRFIEDSITADKRNREDDLRPLALQDIFGELPFEGPERLQVDILGDGLGFSGDFLPDFEGESSLFSRMGDFWDAIHGESGADHFGDNSQAAVACSNTLVEEGDPLRVGEVGAQGDEVYFGDVSNDEEGEIVTPPPGSIMEESNILQAGELGPSFLAFHDEQEDSFNMYGLRIDETPADPVPIGNQLSIDGEYFTWLGWSKVAFALKSIGIEGETVW